MVVPKRYALHVLSGTSLWLSCPDQPRIKRTDIRNTTGVIGVARVQERTRSGNWLVRYVASWPERSGKRGKASFSVALYGEKEAFTACPFGSASRRE